MKRLHDREKSRADELERVTAALTRSLTSGLIAIDANGRIVDINAAGRDILGIAHEEPLSGRELRDVVKLPAFANSLQTAFEQQSAMTRVEIDDEAVTIGLTTVPLRNESGAFLGFLALFTDLTPIRSLEMRVQEMTTLAQLGEISAGIAHEFRSSLSTILGYMKLARRGAVDDVAEGRLQSADKEAAPRLKVLAWDALLAVRHRRLPSSRGRGGRALVPNGCPRQLRPRVAQAPALRRSLRERRRLWRASTRRTWRRS